MTDEDETDEAITMFICGPGQLCKDGKPHDSDGPWEKGEVEGGATFGTATCSRCGVSAMTLAAWYGP
jgi:hypothetical protein